MSRTANFEPLRPNMTCGGEGKRGKSSARITHREPAITEELNDTCIRTIIQQHSGKKRGTPSKRAREHRKEARGC